MKLRPVLLLTGPLGSVPEILVAYILQSYPDNFCPRTFSLIPASLNFIPLISRQNPFCACISSRQFIAQVSRVRWETSTFPLAP
jgi:hypothetical protein